MKVLMYCDGIPAADRSAYLYRTEEFVRRGHEAIIITTGGREEIDTDLEIHRVPHYHGDYGRIGDYYNAALYFLFGLIIGLRLWYRHDFDLVRALFADTPGPTAAVMAWLTGLPFVVSVHGRGLINRPGIDLEEHGIPQMMASPGSLKARLLDRVYAAADTIFVVSDFITEFITHQDKAVTLPPPVNTTQYVSQEPPENAVLTVARLSNRKNVETAIKAFERADTDMEYWIVGDGPRYDALKDQYASETVKFFGFQGEEQVQTCFGKARMFLLPSRFEPFGTVYVEALAAGCPIIAADQLSGATEIVGDTAAGRLVDPSSVAEMAAAIREVDQKQGMMAEQAVERAQRYTIEPLTDRMIAAYRQAANPEENPHAA